MILKLEKALLFLTVLFLPTQLGRHFWPKFSYVYSLPIDYLSPTIYFWDLLVIMLVGVFLIQRRIINKGALNLFLLFILTQLLSLVPITKSMDGLSLGASLVRLEQYMVAGLFGVYLASTNLSKVKYILFWSLSISLMVESILAIVQFLKAESVGFWILGERNFSLSTPAIAKFDFQGIELLRPYATFPHPNVLAAFILITIPLLQIFRSNGPLMTSISTIVGGIAAVLTVSRAALVVGLLEAFLLLKRKVFIFFIAVLLIVSPFLYTRYLAVFNFDNLSFLRREQLSEVAIEIFLSAPYIGVGLNNFIPQAADKLLVGPSRFLQPAHNIFLLTLSETGLIGFLGLMIFIVFPIWRLLKMQSMSRQNHQIRALFLIWSIIIFLGMFDHYFLTLPQGYRLLFLIWGISMSMLE